MHRRHLSRHNLVCHAMNILQSTSICLQTQHRIRCLRIHRCHYLPIAFYCMGISLEHLPL